MPDLADSLPPVATDDPSPAAPLNLSPRQAHHLLQLVQTHQIELEQQNAQLRHTLEQLDASRAQFFDFYDKAPVGYLTLSHQGLILQANLTAAAMLGLSRSGLRQQLLSRFVFAADQDDYYLHRQQLAATAGSIFFDVRLVRADGKVFWAHIAANNADNNNAFEGDTTPVLRLVVTDIDDRKIIEVARLQTEEKFRNLFELSPDAIVVSDAAGRINAVNQQAEQLFGYRRSELIGQTIEVLMPARFHASHVRLRERYVGAPRVRPQKEAHPLLARCKDGREVPVHISLSPIATPEGVLVISTIRDISESQRVEAELKEAKNTADHANLTKSRFLAAASHDLRQPLSALSLYVGVLKKRATPDGAELVNSIENCVTSLSELLTDMLDVSKLEAGAVVPRPSDFSLDEMLTTLVSVHQAEAIHKGLALRYRPCRNLVRTDPQLLLRIVNNFLANAIRYTEHGGVLLAGRQRAGKTWVEVWDTGIGIAPDQAGIIFEEFSQLGDAARTQGSGLGLAIAARMATLLGLTIRMQSRPGRGSVFAIEIPLAGAPVPAPQASAVPVSAQGLTIALVDDNPNVLLAMTLMLETAGHQVLGAANADQLMEKLRDAELKPVHAPDVIVSDYRLAAAQTGFDVIERVRTRFGVKMPAIIITGDTDPALIRSMADRGIPVHYKPLQADALLAAISAAVTPTTGADTPEDTP